MDLAQNRTEQKITSRTEPERRDGRLGQVLGPLLELRLRLAAAGLLLPGELQVRPPLLQRLRLRVVPG